MTTLQRKTGDDVHVPAIGTALTSTGHLGLACEIAWVDAFSPELQVAYMP